MYEILAVTSLEGLIPVVKKLVIYAVIFWLVLWFIGWVGIPEPFLKVLRVIVGLVALIFLVQLLLGLTT
jgi:hypothetical protein